MTSPYETPAQLEPSTEFGKIDWSIHELTKLALVAIVAEALGYSAKTIESHASASGADYARYVGAIVGNE